MPCPTRPFPDCNSKKTGGCLPVQPSSAGQTAAIGQPMPHGDMFHPGAKGELLTSLARTYADKVFAYVLTTVKVQAGQFVQHGSAPNFQGELITLCTCMHYHRTWWPTWKGKWVAGLCGTDCAGGNQLFYLMRVGGEEGSQFEMWCNLSAKTRTAKSARTNPFGDIYEPDTTSHSSRFSPSTYHRPIRGHKHEPNDYWKQDIRFRYPNWPAAHPKLLSGDPDLSFVWRKPQYSFIGPGHHPRFKVYDSLSAFAAILK